MNLVRHLKKKNRSTLSLSNTKICCKLHTEFQKKSITFEKNIYLGILPQTPTARWGYRPSRTLPPSLLTPKMIVSHVELEEQMRYANAYYLRKSGVHSNNNASNVLYA